MGLVNQLIINNIKKYKRFDQRYSFGLAARNDPLPPRLPPV